MKIKVCLNLEPVWSFVDSKTLFRAVPRTELKIPVIFCNLAVLLFRGSGGEILKED